MASIPQCIVLTTAMVLSSTVLYLAFSRRNILPLFHLSGNSDSQESNKQILRSCLCSEGKRRDGNKKKKKVQFAENVKEASAEPREEQRKQNSVSRNCINEIQENIGMPANRIALYNGILRDRVRRIECS